MCCGSIQIDTGAAMIEMNPHVRIPLSRMDGGRVKRSPADRVDALVRVDVIWREVQFAGFVMNHSSAHRDGVPQNFVSQAELFEPVNSPRRHRQVIRATANEVAGAWVRPPLI